GQLQRCAALKRSRRWSRGLQFDRPVVDERLRDGQHRIGLIVSHNADRSRRLGRDQATDGAFGLYFKRTSKRPREKTRPPRRNDRGTLSNDEPSHTADARPNLATQQRDLLTGNQLSINFNLCEELKFPRPAQCRTYAGDGGRLIETGQLHRGPAVGNKGSEIRPL